MIATLVIDFLGIVFSGLEKTVYVINFLLIFLNIFLLVGNNYKLYGVSYLVGNVM